MVYLIVDHYCLTVYFKAKILIVIFDFSASLHISYNRHWFYNRPEVDNTGTTTVTQRISQRFYIPGKV